MNLTTSGQGRSCLSCGKLIKGRSDKKFCNDNCRNNFNNHLKSNEKPLIKDINNILRKNRRILETMIKPGEVTAKNLKAKMLAMGFNFGYFTNVFTNKKGLVYYFCYEYGYLLLDGDWVLIVKRKE
ncbi:MAG: hypothetical protein ABIN89_11940 [Chitinophagaceae bacterium]